MRIKDDSLWEDEVHADDLVGEVDLIVSHPRGVAHHHAVEGSAQCEYVDSGGLGELDGRFTAHEQFRGHEG